jgi:hypothetical protein
MLFTDGMDRAALPYSSPASTVRPFSFATWVCICFLDAGIKGARAGCPTTKIAIHTDLGNHIVSDGIDYVIGWYKNLTAGIGAETFDLIGLSM